jgi:predicted GIY-YIG superfamily endonuclease
MGPFMSVSPPNSPGEYGNTRSRRYLGSPRYGVDRLAWFETHDSAEAARRREKQIKEWKRDWKFNLIEHDNPHWADLYPNLTGL